MKNFFSLLIFCLISFTISEDTGTTYLCRKPDSQGKNSNDLTKEDCEEKIDKGKCCFVVIDQDDRDIHKMCAKVEGVVNGNTIKKLKEELGEETIIKIECNSCFLRTALIYLLIVIGILI